MMPVMLTLNPAIINTLFTHLTHLRVLHAILPTYVYFTPAGRLLHTCWMRTSHLLDAYFTPAGHLLHTFWTLTSHLLDAAIIVALYARLRQTM